MRQAQLKRTTAETDIQCSLNLDGSAQIDVNTGIGFFDHMLTLWAFHSGYDLTLRAQGDLEVCDHHTIEDCGIVLGYAFKEALGDCVGIARYGNMRLPMDEVLCDVTLDISGRPYLVCNVEFMREKVGEMSTEMVEEFLRAFAFNAGMTLHVNVEYGKNDHHKIEAIFKALGRACKQASQIVSNSIQSSKGSLV